MAALTVLQNGDGYVTLEDLRQVKDDICAQQGVSSTSPGRSEVNLIWTFLGGEVRGFIETSDVERFLNGKLPLMLGEISLSA